MPPRVKISIQLEHAETLQGFISGGMGTSDCDEFNKQMGAVLKQLDKKVNDYYKTKKDDKQINNSL